jgi:hypothetical protein
MNQVIASAIKNRQILAISYHGFTRTVEPHTYGINHKGNEVLRCYQIAGGSVSGSPSPWKLLRLDEMRSIATTGNVFQGPRRDYKRDDKDMQRIFAQL